MKKIVKPLLQWYHEQKRILPWRENRNAYRIWVSEIMLQQTRVEAVKPYFQRFMENLPAITDLAQADEEKLLKLWEGLGYYNRVKNMQKAAKIVVDEFNGTLPADYEKLLALPGIGPYTAGAIASIAYQLPYTAVDGNVLRVIARLTAENREVNKEDVKKDMTQKVQKILPKTQAGDFNQALMELGAIICLPNGVPLCTQCPLRKFCEAYKQGRMMDFPVKAPKKIRKIENRNVFFIVYQGRIALKKRTEKGLLSGLWELPNVLQEQAVFESLLEWGILEGETIPIGQTHHIFTHIRWEMQIYLIEVKKLDKESQFQWLTSEEIEKEYALPTAFRSCYLKGIKASGM